MIWIMYAILGVFLIKGKLGYCDIKDYYNVNQTSVKQFPFCLIYKCEEIGATWETRRANFEHIFNAL